MPCASHLPHYGPNWGMKSTISEWSLLFSSCYTHTWKSTSDFQGKMCVLKVREEVRQTDSSCTGTSLWGPKVSFFLLSPQRLCVDGRDFHPHSYSSFIADQFYTHHQAADGCLSVRRNMQLHEILKEKSGMVILSLELLFGSSCVSVCVEAFWGSARQLDWLAVRCQSCLQEINLEQPFCPLDKVHLPQKALISFTHSLQWRKWGDAAEGLGSENFESKYCSSLHRCKIICSIWLKAV